MAHLLLFLLRGLVFLKQKVGPLLRFISRPFFWVGFLILRRLIIPGYRFAFFVRRHVARVLLPVKNKALYFISNRYAIHGTVIVLGAIVAFSNIRQSEVRAESFGEQSILYALVSPGAQTTEIVRASDVRLGKPSSYTSDPIIDYAGDVDTLYSEDEYTTTSVGTGAISTLPSPQQKPSVAARTHVEEYVVQSGDTLGHIAETYGLSLSSVLWANNLTGRSPIRDGQKLVIPPVDGVLYTVKKGDSVSKIAKQFGADSQQILAFNLLESVDALTVGSQIVVPGGEPPKPVVRAPVANIFKPTPSVPSAPRGSAEGVGKWVWPTDWRVITQYYGWKHTGVDIDGDYTTHSYAAADGTVIYSGWRNGYGYTIEVDHGGGLVTRYAHHSKLYVEVGEKVKAGQSIAQTGTTGHSTGTHLHFEVIKNKKFQNPLDYVR
ncbi:M23 family metallopeptidase [Candidatus Uhrbacteria bacterium]|nr:M23 family metallopeptidase [Candidatus Uhrbacteria bacterium]